MKLRRGPMSPDAVIRPTDSTLVLNSTELWKYATGLSL